MVRLIKMTRCNRKCPFSKEDIMDDIYCTHPKIGRARKVLLAKGVNFPPYCPLEEVQE